jgi:hypothetical protein
MVRFDRDPVPEMGRHCESAPMSYREAITAGFPVSDDIKICVAMPLVTQGQTSRRMFLQAANRRRRLGFMARPAAL